MRKKKILLVDPDLQLLTYALGSLREAGYDVISESDATKAMALAGRWCPHLVIAPSRTLVAWQQEDPEGLQALPPGSALLVDGPGRRTGPTVAKLGGPRARNPAQANCPLPRTARRHRVGHEGHAKTAKPVGVRSHSAATVFLRALSQGFGWR